LLGSERFYAQAPAAAQVLMSFVRLGFKEIPNCAAILTMLAGDRFISSAIARTDFKAPASRIKYRSSA
jgi:hypothetical protein